MTQPDSAQCTEVASLYQILIPNLSISKGGMEWLGEGGEEGRKMAGKQTRKGAGKPLVKPHSMRSIFSHHLTGCRKWGLVVVFSCAADGNGQVVICASAWLDWAPSHPYLATYESCKKWMTCLCHWPLPSRSNDPSMALWHAHRFSWFSLVFYSYLDSTVY